MDLKSLDEAAAVVKGDRHRDYGDPQGCFSSIGQAWDAYIRKNCCEPVKSDGTVEYNGLVGKDVAALMVLMKCIRGLDKRDSCIDVIGYAALAADVL